MHVTGTARLIAYTVLSKLSNGGIWNRIHDTWITSQAYYHWNTDPLLEIAFTYVEAVIDHYPHSITDTA